MEKAATIEAPLAAGSFSPQEAAVGGVLFSCYTDQDIEELCEQAPCALAGWLLNEVNPYVIERVLHAEQEQDQPRDLVVRLLEARLERLKG